MHGFHGLPPELFIFFADLEHDNTKEFWTANKHVWKESVEAPMRALLSELEDEFPPMRLFRPNRDLRYTRDRSPYKLFTGATSDASPVGGSGFHLRVDADGLTIACGAMLMSPTELQLFRAAIDAERSGSQFEDLAATLNASSLPVTPGLKPALKRTPASHPAQHPRAEFLRWKGAAMVAEFEVSAWIHTPEMADSIRNVWRAAHPLMDWLSTHVSADIRSR